jgi:tetraacyldisaccharide 4'-kinase
MDEHTFQDILSGKRRGIAPALLRGALSIASLGYGTAIAVRGIAFDSGWRRIHQAPVPVISVGNLTTGGTGKTPFVAWLIQELRRRGRQPGLLSRGYHSLSEGANDEARVIERLCPGVPHVQNPDRVAGARELLTFANADILVLDDGFQHRRLHRDLDIVLVDALQPWGYGRLLPRGLLREPPSALRRADVVLITRADQIEPGAIEELRHQIPAIRGARVDGELSFRPTRLVNVAGQSRPLSSVADRRIAAFCGIGNPVGFEQSLRQLGATGPCRAFPDHHRYTVADWDALEAWRHSLGADVLVTTLKDLVKAPPNADHFWAVDIEVHWLTGRDRVASRIDALFGEMNSRAAG